MRSWAAALWISQPRPPRVTPCAYKPLVDVPSQTRAPAAHLVAVERHQQQRNNVAQGPGTQGGFQWNRIVVQLVCWLRCVTRQRPRNACCIHTQEMPTWIITQWCCVAGSMLGGITAVTPDPPSHQRCPHLVYPTLGL